MYGLFEIAERKHFPPAFDVLERQQQRIEVDIHPEHEKMHHRYRQSGDNEQILFDIASLKKWLFLFIGPRRCRQCAERRYLLCQGTILLMSFCIRCIL